MRDDRDDGAPPRPPAEPRPPSMADVAARAGVSHQTVSRVVNAHPSVLPGTRERVLAAIDALGYRRNSAARALVTRRSGVLGAITVGGTDYGPTSTLLELEDAARAAGYVVTVATLRRGDEASIGHALDRLLDVGVEAVVVVAPTVGVAAVLEHVRASVPVLLVSSWVAGLQGGPRPVGVHAVAVGQQEGARLATEHLLAAGHREVVHLAGPQDWFDAQDRVAGWREACAVAGVRTRAPITSGWDAADGYAAGRRLLDEGVPSAVFAANDQLALGLLRALAEAGVRVPEDVAVVGFDDEPGAAFYSPPLTTVRQDFAALGRAALETLTAALAGGDPADVVLTPQLVVRASSHRPS
ncbi:LacI family DNA-binding transcriptional regulator [Cellulomonas endophytica]|uniref:LacI family DNA-binding transcriptional regulator n=1 Tax=Cellulomonas endophytica TaxID=2494735 RepID=UPI0030B85A51